MSHAFQRPTPSGEHPPPAREQLYQTYPNLDYGGQRTQAPYPGRQQYAPQLPQLPGTPPAMSALLDKVPLGTDAENSQLLDMVDKLRECRVDRFIDLPQVVAVGDQSSGKSSVLEAITRIPFPTDSVQCTRYATQIQLRRDAAATQTTTRVSIIAFDAARDQKRYDAFKHQVDEGADFGDIFKRATALIFQNEKQNFLSRDILSIERTGPDVPHLTIVDLPGIIHNPTQTQTAADVDAISDLSKLYMHKERTIILAIVGCDAEYAKQVIVRRCKEADPAGVRTMGVITKPDMSLTESREKMFLDLASNKDERNRLLLGWHVLRNRAHNETHFTSDERDLAEQRFFAGSRWGTTLAPSQLGVETLRKKLSTQLIRHIASEVFKVQADIEALIARCRDRLQMIGPGWDTIEQMREEFYALCKRSAGLTRMAVQGQGINPLGEDFFPLFNEGSTRYSRNLRSRVVISNEQFSDGLEKWGAACLIQGSSGANNATVDPSSVQGAFAPPLVSRADFIAKEVRPLIKDNPGQEVSVDINPLLVYRLFQQYSRKWPQLADEHIGSVQSLCEDFLREVMEYAWPRSIQSQVWSAFVLQALESRIQKAQSELEKLKKDRFRYVRTYHSAFDRRYYEQREPIMVQADRPQPERNPTDKYEDTLNKMLLHYEHQLPTFINNVILQVVERHLMDGMEEIFERERVLQLSDTEVQDLMEEDFATRGERRDIKEELAVLQTGLDICKQISRRSDLGPYESSQLRRNASTSSRMGSFAGGQSYSPMTSRRQPPIPAALNIVSPTPPHPMLPPRPQAPLTPPSAGIHASGSNRSSMSPNRFSQVYPPVKEEQGPSESSMYVPGSFDSPLTQRRSYSAPKAGPPPVPVVPAENSEDEEEQELKRAIEESLKLSQTGAGKGKGRREKK